ncbi:MOG interacting and ectopic P-granules protein 1 [Ditylenchus destructor]|nr:MOG interacting and ectopic P-granules protein 1 [Ditylenchus destructor]
MIDSDTRSIETIEPKTAMLTEAANNCPAATNGKSDEVHLESNNHISNNENHIEQNGQNNSSHNTHAQDEGSSTSVEIPPAKNGSVEKQPSVECIELDDDDDIQEIPVAEPQPKRRRSVSPVPEDPKVTSAKESTPDVAQLSINKNSQPKKVTTELTSYSALLDRLESYVRNAVTNKDNVERKVLDALLVAINNLVQKEPHSVRELIIAKQLVLPNSISLPPSQVVDLLIEHDPEHHLSKVITKMFGNERPKPTDNEIRERQQLKKAHPAPNMTKLLMDIGQDLVQESTYCDIVHARNLPEVPKNMETYKQVASQLKPVWEALKTKNAPLHLSVYTCQVSQCGFKTDSRTVLSIHRQTLHFINRKYQCAMCPEYDTNENRITVHYLHEHQVKPLPESQPPGKVQCPICEEDFNYKGHRDQHLKLCKKDINRLRTLQASTAPEHIGIINRWLWDKPPVEQILTQQDTQRQQQLKQQQAAAALALQQQQQRLAMATAAAAQQLTHSPLTNRAQPNNSMAQQQLIAQRLKNSPLANIDKQHLAQLLRQQPNLTPQMIQAAMQLQIRQTAPTPPVTKSIGSPLMNSTPKQQPMKTKNNPGAKGSMLNSSSPLTAGSIMKCEICDSEVRDRYEYLNHLKQKHNQMKGKGPTDMVQGPPLACSRCRERCWTYEGLERHLVMEHGLVTSDLLVKAQNKEDGGRCKLCAKQYAFNMLQHLAWDHKIQLSAADIQYSCDVCSFKCKSYPILETHLTEVHKNK